MTPRRFRRTHLNRSSTRGSQSQKWPSNRPCQNDGQLLDGLSWAGAGEPSDTRPAARDRPRAAGRLVEAGQTVAQMAVELGVTPLTVRRRLVRYGLKTEATRRMLRAREAEKAGLETLTMSCPVHGEIEFILEGRGYFRCKQCRMDRVARRRRRVKEILVADAGGRCRLCGYDKYLGALEFHHLDPKEKRLEIGYVALALETMRAEARKCLLLCSNCHAEVEGGVANIPLQFRRQVPNS